LAFLAFFDSSLAWSPQESVNFVTLMSSSYLPQYWHFESIDLLRKLLNTAVVAVTWQGTMLQLWFAAVAAGLTLFLYALLQPYQDTLCNRVQLMALLHLLVTHLSTVLFVNSAYVSQVRQQQAQVVLTADC
jgi:hypothetical protein